MSHAAVFIVVFQVYVNSFILKSNCNEFDEKPFFLSYKKLVKFQAEKFSYIRVPYDKKIQAAVSYKLVSYMWYANLEQQKPLCRFF